MSNDTLSELGASTDLNRQLVEAVAAGLVHVRIDGTIVAANREALRVLGLSYDELTQRYTQDFEPDTIFEDGSPCTVAEYPVTLALQTGEVQAPVTIGVKRPDGGVSWSIYTAVPVTDPATGATTGAVVTILDITKRKEDEEARRELENRLLFSERMAAVGTLAAGVAHEVNNPLTYVLGNLEEARVLVAGDATLTELLRDAHSGARQIREVVRELASFAKVDADEAAVSLGEVLDTTLRLAGNDLRHRAQLIKDYDSSLRVRGGRSKLGQLCLNLIINAIQAIPAGDASSNTVRIAVRPTGSGTVLLTVRDSGVGIPPNMIGRIFDPFVTSKRQESSSGLGLYVCHSIATDLGGTITVNSVPGQGATFVVELPAAGEELPMRQSDPPRNDPATGSHSVLIIDDEPVVRRVIARIFKRWDAVEAAGGREALTLLDDREFDVILCDLMMPEMTGPEFFEEVGRTKPHLQERFVFITGAAFTQEASKFVESVDRPVLNKPFQRTELLETVSQITGASATGE